MSTLLQDLFADTNGTNLTAHTMTVGAGWSQDATFTGALTIQSNQARMPTGIGVVFADAGQADCTLTADLVLGNASTDNAIEAGFVLRYANANTYWLARVAQTGGAGTATLDIYENASGFTLKAQSSSFALTYNTTHALQAVLSGSSLSLSIDGGTPLTFTMGTDLSNTKVGLWGRDNNATGLFNFDNFLAASAAGGVITAGNYYHQMIGRSGLNV